MEIWVFFSTVSFCHLLAVSICWNLDPLEDLTGENVLGVVFYLWFFSFVLTAMC